MQFTKVLGPSTRNSRVFTEEQRQHLSALGSSQGIQLVAQNGMNIVEHKTVNLLKIHECACMHTHVHMYEGARGRPQVPPLGSFPLGFLSRVSRQCGIHQVGQDV